MSMPRLTIATRFLIAVGIPSLVLMFFAGLEVRHAWLQSRAATVAEDGVALVRDASALVHELQKERGASAGYLGSGGDAEFRERVQGQRGETDAAAQRFAGRLAAYRDAGLAPVIEQAEEALAISAELEAKRDAVDELRIPLGDMAGWYTTQIGELISIAPTLRSASRKDKQHGQESHRKRREELEISFCAINHQRLRRTTPTETWKGLRPFPSLD